MLACDVIDTACDLTDTFAAYGGPVSAVTDETKWQYSRSCLRAFWTWIINEQDDK